VGERDHVSMPPASIPKARNESEGFRRDPVDRRDRVFPGLDEIEDLESISLKGIELERNVHQ